MRRTMPLLAIAALVGSTLAFAPAVTEQAAQTEEDGGSEGATTDEQAFIAPADSAPRIDVTEFEGIPTEAAGDWGDGGDQAAIGSALGQDFEAAYLEYVDDTIIFTLDMTELPAPGGMPEATRYGWSFRYNDLHLELDGKFTNYSRGACDPTAGTCPPPRDPGMAPFLIRGNCYQDSSTPITLTLCEELANVSATFDPADGTITVPIPAAALAPDGVQGCDVIAGTESFIGPAIWAAPSAFITNTAMPNDTAAHHTALVIPPADPDVSC